MWYLLINTSMSSAGHHHTKGKASQAVELCANIRATKTFPDCAAVLVNAHRIRNREVYPNPGPVMVYFEYA